MNISFNKSVLLAIALMAGIAVSAGAVDIPKENAIGAAKKALADKGAAVVDCNIVYDEKNKAWEEWGTYVARTPNDRNHGYLPHGILQSKKYQAVYFDFYDDAKKDVWVFVDLMTGETLAIYEKK
jgi:hypothetical protein